MEEIIIIADNRFPVSNAATTRIYMLCKLFQALNYRTRVFIINVKQKKRFHLSEENIDCRWFADDKTWAVRYFKENEAVTEAVKKRKNLKYVILYQEVLLQTLAISKMASQCGFEVVAYFDEWYEWGQAGGSGVVDRFAKSMSIRISEYVIAQKIKNKIVISRGLKRFYKRDNCLLLPTMVDMSDEIWEKDYSVTNDKIVILYAGWPGNRDDLRMLVEVVDELSEKEKSKILLRIFTYGTTENDLKVHIPDLERIRRNNRGIIEFCGEVAHEQAIEELKKADFSYLLRENKWSNNAGFSTKIGESLAAGTPLFANCTSDIGYYVKDGFNGILIDDMSKEAVKFSLYKILGLSKEKCMKMKKNAHKTAMRYFDYRQYLEQTEIFLKWREDQ